MQLGVIGLGTMGANLARNAARNGAEVIVYNRTQKKTDAFLSEFGNEGNCIGVSSYNQLIQELKPPRAILIMVKAGDPVDAVIEELTPLLKKGDILIDGGNSHYSDTSRRVQALQPLGIGFVGMGVSGGEEGALFGPSMMPGGDKKTYGSVEQLLSDMSADDGIGGKCISFIGSDGAGHFVKMVHNGIEYGVMQLIAEAYDILKTLGEFSNEELHDTFVHWNDSDILNSYLLEITAQIFAKADDQGGQGQLVDYVQDIAGQKGTGKWTTQTALDYGVAIPTITAAVDARILSGSLDLRKKMKTMPSSYNTETPMPPKEKLRSMVRAALTQSIITAYHQGFALIGTVSDDERWNINVSECARIWRGGCIIRSAVLQKFQDVFGSDAKKAQAAHEAIKARFVDEKQQAWRSIVALAALRGTPVPAMSASLSYFDALQKKRLPQSLIQAQRDFFGAHTFMRTDKKGTFHAEWEQAG